MSSTICIIISCCPFPSGPSAEGLAIGSTSEGDDNPPIVSGLLPLLPLLMLVGLVLFSPPAAEGAAKKAPERKPRLLDLRRPGKVAVGAVGGEEDDDVEDTRAGMARWWAGTPAAGTEEEEDEDARETELDLLIKNCKRGDGGGDGDEERGALFVLEAVLGSAMAVWWWDRVGVRLKQSCAFGATLKLASVWFWIARAGRLPIGDA